MHLLCQQSEEVLFGHVMTTLNAAFESKLASEDEGYESGSETFNIPRCIPRIHHVSSDDNTSFDPTTQCSTGTSQSHHKPVHHQLSFNSAEDEENPEVDISPPQNLPDLIQQPDSKSIYPICGDLEVDEEDFQTVPLEDDHWTTEEIPDRHLCIHKHSLCPYPCPCMDYTSTLFHNTLDLSDISEFEDLMTTSSDEDIPVLDDEIWILKLWTMVGT